MEQWKDVYFIENGIEYDYRGLYQVNNRGIVKSLGNGNSNNSKEKILKAAKNKEGYQAVFLYKEGNKKMFRVHRLVAHMFIYNDDPEHKVEVNHIDENKENNSVENLEWCTKEYNLNHGTRNERLGKASGKARSRKVIGYSLISTKVIILKSTQQAKKFGFNQGNVCAACKEKYHKSHEYKGYKWYYLDNVKNNKSFIKED